MHRRIRHRSLRIFVPLRKLVLNQGTQLQPTAFVLTAVFLRRRGPQTRAVYDGIAAKE